MLTLASSLASAVPVDLRCEDSVAPMTIDADRPRFSWLPGSEQSAYQLCVSSSLERLAADQGDLWDSGKVASTRSVFVEFAGKPLAPVSRAFWKVRIWDEAGKASPWSEAASITMGPRNEADWSPAKWITTPPANPHGSVLLRREFEVRGSIVRAVVFATGLGHYELSLNGRKIGDQLLAPGWSDYRRTVLYDGFDVTDQIRAGQNVIGITLGNGMYDIQPTKGRYVKFLKQGGAQKAIAHLRLDYADGTMQVIGTDSSWQGAPGPITYSNVFAGEDFDARLEPVGWDQPGFAGKWISATETEMPGIALRGHSGSAPPIKAIETRRPVSAKVMSPSVTIYDLGPNASFIPRFTVRGPAGSFVRVIPSELLGTDGYIDRASCVQDEGGSAWWQHTLAGSGAEKYVPKFFYQGCRYLQVERFAAEKGGALPIVESIEGVVVHSSAEAIGSFECSNDLFNKIYHLVRWAQRSNMMSVMTDCPQREKLGWLEQLHLNGPSLRYNFRNGNLYAKQMNDMADSQLENGFVPNIAPEYFLAHTDKLTDKFRNSPEWGSSFIIAPWQQYQFTGDDSLLRKHYAKMVAYVDFLSTMAEGGIISIGLGDWYDLGPKPPWGSQLTPPPFTATAIYYYDLCIMADIATLLGRAPDEAAAYQRRAEDVRRAFNEKFFDAQSGRYATGSQCTSAMPLVLGLVEPEHRATVLQTLIDDIRDRGNALSAGDVGYRFVLRALADAGRNDVIFDMNNQTERPGYGMQIMKGATALTEKWDASVGSFGSHNHFMLGQINEWLSHDLAGIQPDPAGPGFERFVIKPAIVGDIEWVKCSFESARGTVRVGWQRQEAGLRLGVNVPPNTHARIFVPTLVGQTAVESQSRAGVGEKGDGYTCFEVSGGSYSFLVK